MLDRRFRMLYVCLTALSLGMAAAAQAADDARSQDSKPKPRAGTKGRYGVRMTRPFASHPFVGGRVLLFIKPQGAVVKAGEVICELDSSTDRDALDRQRIDLESLEATAKNLRLSVEAAELAFQEEEAALNDARKSRHEALAVAKGRLDLATSSGSADSVERAKGEVEAIEAELEKGTGELDRTRLQPLAESLAQALKAADEHQAAVEQARRDLSAIEERIAIATIKATNDGRVVYARWRPRPSTPDGYAVLEPGVVIAENQPIIRVDPIGLPRRPPRLGPNPRRSSGDPSTKKGPGVRKGLKSGFRPI